MFENSTQAREQSKKILKLTDKERDLLTRLADVLYEEFDLFEVATLMQSMDNPEAASVFSDRISLLYGTSGSSGSVNQRYT